jgi:predicted neuraminidase
MTRHFRRSSLNPRSWTRSGVLLAWVWVVGSGPFETIAEEPYLDSRLIFPLSAEHNHAPGIAELANGDLLVSWYRGSGERKADDVAVWGARRSPTAQSWSKPFLMADTPGFPDCNTCMMVNADGELFLFWPLILANSWESCLTQYRVSRQPIGEGCPTWDRHGQILLKPVDYSDRAHSVLNEVLADLPRPLTPAESQEINTIRNRLGDKLYQRLGWQPRCKPTILPSGRILLPLYSDTYSFSIMAISDDGGTTWRASEPLLGFGNIQPSVLRRADGTLVAYMRENGISGTIPVCESHDDGETWGSVTRSELPNPGSGLDAVALKNGHWILVHNDTSDGRNRLAVSLSTDEGLTWPWKRHLENSPSGSFHYPCIIQGRSGTLHCVYSYFVSEGKSMKYATFNEAWIKAGTKLEQKSP